MANFKRIVGFLESTMTSSRRMFLIIAFLAFSAGCAATKQPSLYDTQPDLLTKQYTADEIKAIEQNFSVNSLQYSQQLGNLLLWQMHQKSPEFALEFAQTPKLYDGLNEKEAKAMISIYNLIKPLNITPDIFVERESDRGKAKLIMEWRGNKESDWSGRFYLMGDESPHFGKVLDAKPIGFEAGVDKLDYENMRREGKLSWTSITDVGDTDGIIVSLQYPSDNKIRLSINNKDIIFKKSDLLSKNQLSFNENDGLEGTLIIKNASETNLTPELYAIRDMVLAGKGDYKFSSPLQALLWGYMDGKFKESDNPLKNYTDALEFVKPVWGDMGGPRWKDFDEVTLRLNLPELIDYYIKNSLSYELYIGDFGSAKLAFKKKGGNCVEIEAFQRDCLNKAGYRAYREKVESVSGLASWHAVTKFYDGGKMYIMDDGTPFPKGVIGPLKSINEAGY